MKNHIIKAVAVLMAFITLMSVMPLAALAELLPTASAPYDFNGDGVIDSADADIFASVQQGKVTDTTSYNAAMGVEVDGKLYDTNDGGKVQIVNSTYSPYEPISTSDPNHPFIQNGAAWINLANLFYGAPATQNYPITKWSANTSVVNVTGTGEKYSEDLSYMDNGVSYNAPAAGEEIYALPDMNLINEYLWADSDKYTETVGGEDQNGIISSQKYPLYYKTSESDTTYQYNVNSVTAKNDKTAYVYNRYDAMQGKWGLTLDKNVSSVTWLPNYRKGYYGTEDMDNSILYLTDTPYLYYSTEAPDTTKIAISLLIGTPVQSEYKTSKDNAFSQTWVSEKQFDPETGEYATDNTLNPIIEYVYRWYTITDNSARPGIDESTHGNSMVPIVHISDPVLWDADKVDDQAGSVLDALLNGFEEFTWDWNNDKKDQDGNVITDADGKAVKIGTTGQSGNTTKADPVAWAAQEGVEGFDTDSMYADGSITGCIDFTTVLPLLMGTMDSETDGSDDGRKDVRYKIAQVRVDTKTKEGADDSAARINYLYFGPAMSTVYTPQSTMGATVNGANWQYAQTGKSIADDDENDGYNEGDANTNITLELHNSKYWYNSYDSGYTNGWENGEAVSIINTPTDPQKIIIDTYGNGDGVLEDVGYDTKGNPTYAIGNEHSAQSTTVIIEGDHSKLWKVDVDGDNELETFEAEYNEADGKYYIMVSLPVRKWINVLGNSRKLTMTMTVEQYGKENTDNDDIGFVLWGNKNGSVGGGHATFGTRFRGEGLLAVFGNDTYYQVDNGHDYATVLIDQTMGQSTVYNTEKVVTLHHRPYVNNDGATNQYNIETVENMQVYADADGKLYYKAIDGTYYTAEPEMSSGENQFPLYVHMADADHPVYFYNSIEGYLCDGDGKKVTTTLSLSVMEPLYVLTQVSSEVDTSKFTVQYDGDEMWADLLRSPYMYGHVIKNGDSERGYGDEMAGYVYVSSLRFAVPIGAKFTVQNMKGDDNSAGLNMYSTDGAVVNAYDGGTGEQPVIDVSTENAGKETHFGSDTTDAYKGTMKAGAAAYGPYLLTSEYTIYDLLDTESLNASASASSDKGASAQQVIGQPTYISSSEYSLSIYSHPYGSYQYDDPTVTNKSPSSGAYQFTNGAGTTFSSYRYGDILKQADSSHNSFMVYGVLEFTNDLYDGNKSWWGLVGVRTSYGADYGWVKLRGGKDFGWNVSKDFDASGNNKLAFYKTYASQSVLDQGLIDECYTALRGHWMYSNLKGTPNSCWTNLSDSITYSLVASDLYHQGHGAGMPLFANEKRAYWNNNGLYMVENNKVSAANTTDMKIAANTYAWNSTYDGWRSASISRTLKTPITLKIDDSGDEKTYPVLYYDFSGFNLDASGQNGGVIMGLTVTVNGVPKTYYLQQSDTDTTKAGSLAETQDTLYGDMYGYISLKKLMTENADKTVQICALHTYYSFNPIDYKSGEMTIRRFEVWMDETSYLDKIYDTDSKLNDSGHATGNIAVADGFNLINDAFYSVHNEDTDAQNGSNPYKKQNSNRGWSALVRVDTDGDHDSTDNVYYSTKDYGTQDDGVYEYRSSLGHLRVWVPGGTEGSVVFTSDRSFNTNHYKYLYYSYSVRDPQTGIAAAAPTDVPGVTVAIKSNPVTSNTAYLQNGYNGFTYFPSGTTYHEGTTDNRGGTYTTTMNAAIDLSTLEDIKSINQLVFYLNNTEKSATAEFYLNYVFLSNVEPGSTVKDAINAPHTQYYYLMDNTGGRYSARFPTVDNPSGAVTGEDNQTRVNPIKVTRGANIYSGTYMSGEPLSGYEITGGSGDNSYVNQYGTDQTSWETYLGIYNEDDLYNYIRMIWFYGAQKSDDEDESKNFYDILDYYRYKDGDDEGADGDITDMLWSYGRWNLGSGESALNTMYVAKEDTKLQKKDYIYGNLMRRYATENYVLLRSGIEPREYPTYYYAGEDGEFFYEGSDALAGEIGNTATDNAYYLTSTVLNDYFMFPRDIDKQNDGQAKIIEPVRYGYKFVGWKRATWENHLATYNRKQVPGMDYFEAEWEATDETPYNTDHFAYFLNYQGATWVTRKTVQSETHKTTVPSIGQMWTADGNMIVAGWKAWTDKDCKTPYEITNTTTGAKEQVTYYSGSSIIMKESKLWFTPILVNPGTTEADGLKKGLLTVTVTNADLKLYIPNDDGTFTTNDPAKQGIGVRSGTDSNTKVYYNIPKNVAMIAYPTTAALAAAASANDGAGADYVWLAPYESKGDIRETDTDAILSTSDEYYRFAVAEKSISISYNAKSTTASEQIGNVTTFQHPNVANRQMTFMSQYEPTATDGINNYKAVAFGTMYLNGVQKPSKPANYINYMKLDESTITAETIASSGFSTIHSAVTQIQGTAENTSNQFALTYAVSSQAKRTIWMRAYVIYQKVGTDANPEYKVAYSNYIVQASVLKYGETATTTTTTTVSAESSDATTTTTEVTTTTTEATTTTVAA